MTGVAACLPPAQRTPPCLDDPPPHTLPAPPPPCRPHLLLPHHLWHHHLRASHRLQAGASPAPAPASGRARSLFLSFSRPLHRGGASATWQGLAVMRAETRPLCASKQARRVRRRLRLPRTSAPRAPHLHCAAPARPPTYLPARSPAHRPAHPPHPPTHLQPFNRQLGAGVLSVMGVSFTTVSIAISVVSTQMVRACTCACAREEGGKEARRSAPLGVGGGGPRRPLPLPQASWRARPWFPHVLCLLVQCLPPPMTASPPPPLPPPATVAAPNRYSVWSPTAADRWCLLYRRVWQAGGHCR